LEDGEMGTESINGRPWPLRVRGEPRVDGDEIVLDPDKAELYDVLSSEDHATLLYDLAALHDFKLQNPVEFVRRHGLIWHGPDEIQQGECRESLKWWSAWGKYLTTTIWLYVALRTGLDEDTAKPVRNLMRLHRDVGLGHGIIPDGKDGLIEHASILLSERITRGLQGCKQTVVAACGVKKGGRPIGPAGDFRYRTEPTDLVGAAHVRLADLVVNKAKARQCKGCGRWFTPKHGSQWHHTPECGRNKRRRDSYWKKKAV
jgi:predicted RNA-binding Zn-ribbon protein involved in translation (DUF1610 family)